jgi:hypothetical protein
VYDKTRWGGFGVILLTFVLSGCIKPDSATKTPGGTPTFGAQVVQPTPYVAGPTPFSPAVTSGGAPPVTNTAFVDQFIRARGDTPTNLQVWYGAAQGPDQLYGYSYLSATGQSCTGFLLTPIVGGVEQPSLNGAQVCGAAPMAGLAFPLTSDGLLYTLIFGVVNDPTITAVAVVYSDGNYQTVSPMMGGFLIIRPGVLGASTITAVNQQGNTVIPNIPQLPPT